LKQVAHCYTLIGTTRRQQTFYLVKRESQILRLLDELHSLNVLRREESKAA